MVVSPIPARLSDLSLRYAASSAFPSTLPSDALCAAAIRLRAAAVIVRRGS